jgi:hypothetical protein
VLVDLVVVLEEMDLQNQEDLVIIPLYLHLKEIMEVMLHTDILDLVVVAPVMEVVVLMVDMEEQILLGPFHQHTDHQDLQLV